MKIDMVIASFTQGGAQRQCAWLANAMAEDPDIEVRVLYFRASDNIDQLNAGLVPTIRIQSHSLYSINNVFKIAHALRKQKPDFVISWLHATDVILGLSRPFLPRSTKWILTERDSNYPSNWRYALRRYLGRNADAIIANSFKGQAYWKSSGFRNDRVFVANNILSPDILTALPAERNFDFVYAGRLEPQKNVLSVMEAFVRLSKRRPELSFGIIGDGSLRDQLAQKLASYGVANRVKLESYNHHVMRVFKSGPIFVNLSLHEGLPNTILENIACGNRIVASFIPEHVEILGLKYPHFVRDYTNPDVIVEILESTLVADWTGDELDYAHDRLNAMSSLSVVTHYKNILRQLERP